MKAILLNIGTSQRAIVDARLRKITIPIGVLTEVDIVESLYQRIEKREAYDSLLVLDENAASIPLKMQVILDVLREFDGIPYERLLGQINEIMGADHGSIVLRPTRDSMRAMLVAAARLYASQKFGVTPNYNKRMAEALTKKPLAYAKAKGKAVADEKDVTVDPYADLDGGASEGGSIEDEDEFERIEKEEAELAKKERKEAAAKAKAIPKAKAKAKAKARAAPDGKKSLPRKRR